MKANSGGEMSSFSKIFSSFVLKIISALPTKYSQSLERLSQSAQGKGWNSGIKNEIESIHLLIEKLRIHEVVALDVGANIGDWSRALKQELPTCEIYAFEPGETAYALLREALGDVTGVFLNKSAVGAMSGDAILYSDQPGSSLASLTKRRLNHLNIDFTNSETIPVTTLDDWQSNNLHVHPNILKIDVEGHELDVLKGATELLKSIRVIQFEFGGTNIDSRTYFQDYWYFFQPLGFTIFRLTPRGLTPVRNYTEASETFFFTTYYAVRN